MSKRAVIATLAAAAAALALAACGGGGPHEVVHGGALVAMTLPAADGGEVDFSRLRGRLVVVHVFATWSLGAQADVEQLDDAYAGNTVAVVGVALDLMPATVVPPWQRGSGAHYPIALADDPVRAGTSVLGAVDRVPMTLLLDRSGAIVRRHIGPLARGAVAKWLHELR